LKPAKISPKTRVSIDTTPDRKIDLRQRATREGLSVNKYVAKLLWPEQGNDRAMSQGEISTHLSWSQGQALLLLFGRTNALLQQSLVASRDGGEVAEGFMQELRSLRKVFVNLYDASAGLRDWNDPA